MAIAVSGVLGPEPDEDGNPVGLVYFCIQAKDKQPKVVKEEFGEQPHDQLLEKALHRAFDLIETALRP
jgi:nicotinamide-nucleotide amidase